MIQLSKVIGKIPPSSTLVAAARANKLRAEGRDIISFTVGEPDMPTPDHIKAAAREALDRNETRYTSSNGTVTLREAIAKKFKRDQNLTYQPTEIIATCGGKQALATALAVSLDAGDEVIIPAPYWVSYPDMVRLAGGVPVFVPTSADDGFKVHAAEVEKRITERTKAIILCSPSNPTGACLSLDEMKEIAEVIRRAKNRILVISDEVYEYIVFGGFNHVSFGVVAPDLREQLLIVNAFSKSYSMTGWRVGFAAGPKELINAMTVHVSQFTSNVCSIAQYAAAKAYDDGGAFPRMMCEIFEKRRDIVVEGIKQMPGIDLAVKPKGAFFAFLGIGGLIDSQAASGGKIKCGEDFANFLLDEYDVVAVAGEPFGDSRSIRISYALAEEQLRKGLERIAEAVASLQ
jgi:aspartate aminotransferase